MYSVQEGADWDFEIHIPNPTLSQPNDLILLVENLGRVNYEQSPRTLNAERKGLTGLVFFNQEPLHIWDAYIMDCKEDFIGQLQNNPHWRTLAGSYHQRQPTFYRVPLSLLNYTRDYFMDFKVHKFYLVNFAKRSMCVFLGMGQRSDVC